MKHKMRAEMLRCISVLLVIIFISSLRKASFPDFACKVAAKETGGNQDPLPSQLAAQRAEALDSVCQNSPADR